MDYEVLFIMPKKKKNMHLQYITEFCPMTECLQYKFF